MLCCWTAYKTEGDYHSPECVVVAKANVNHGYEVFVPAAALRGEIVRHIPDPGDKVEEHISRQEHNAAMSIHRP